MVGIVLLGVFVLLLAFGAPIAVCLGMSSVAAILVQGAGKPLVAVMSVLPRICSASSSKFVLLAIPFFIISGNVMEKAGISGRLINLAEKCLGHIKGGMAIVCVVVSCFFAAISGSGPATVAALGLIMIPALVKAGYPAAFSCALMAAGGAIGVVIPPSITFVVYGSIADASITDLFKAGMVPGLAMGAGLIIVALIPLALKGVKYREVSASKLLSRNLLVYGIGGIITPFICIKVIDMLLVVCHLV